MPCLVLAGLLFLAGLVAALVLFLREHGAAIFTQDDALASGERRAVLRAIRRDEAIEPRLREAALRVARRTSARGGWSVYWMLNWCLIGGFNAAVQSGLVRLLWLGLTVLALGAAGYALRHIGRARLAVARFSDQR